MDLRKAINDVMSVHTLLAILIFAFLFFPFLPIKMVTNMLYQAYRITEALGLISPSVACKMVDLSNAAGVIGTTYDGRQVDCALLEEEGIDYRDVVEISVAKPFYRGFVRTWMLLHVFAMGMLLLVLFDFFSLATGFRTKTSLALSLGIVLLLYRLGFPHKLFLAVFVLLPNLLSWVLLVVLVVGAVSWVFGQILIGASEALRPAPMEAIKTALELDYARGAEALRVARFLAKK